MQEPRLLFDFCTEDMQIWEVSQVLVDMNNALTVGRISIPLYEQRASGDECLWAVTTLIHEEYPVVGRGT